MNNHVVEYNKFHEFFTRIIAIFGLTSVEVAEKLSDDKVATRQYPWHLSFKPSLTARNRIAYLEKLARLLREPLSKLMFFAGMNPWATRLSLNDQEALWTFCERIVKCKEEDPKMLSISFYATLKREMFGGLTVEDNDLFVERLRDGQTKDDAEDVGDTA